MPVPGLDLEPLEFEMQAKKGDDAVVAGFPRDSGFTVVPARIRAETPATGTRLLPLPAGEPGNLPGARGDPAGNSGGRCSHPGEPCTRWVFAAATNDEETGYVLTAEEVAANAEAGIRATTPVSTQECD